MSYCYDFIRKFKKEGNFCGLDKSEVSRLENYIEIIDALMEKHKGLQEKQIVDNFPLGAARHLLPIKDERREEGLNFVASQISEGKHISGKDICKKLEISNNKPQTKPESVKDALDEKQLNDEDYAANVHHAQYQEYSKDNVPTASIAQVLKEKYNPPHVSESPFITGAQDKDGVVPAPIVPTSAPTTEADLKKQRLELMEHHARELIKLFSPEIQRIVRETRDYRTSYGDKDVIYAALLAFDAVKVNKR